MIIAIHPQNPQMRQISRAVDLLKKGGVLAYPTDTLFAVGCDVRNAKAIDSISRITGRDKHATFSFLCSDFSQADQYAKISNHAFRIMKHVLPGPYTFILPASTLVPKRIAANRKKVGIRIPDSRVCQAVIRELGAPLASASIGFEDNTWAGDAYTIDAMIGHQLDGIIDSGVCDSIPSTVIDLTDGGPSVLREGKGDVAFLAAYE